MMASILLALLTLPWSTMCARTAQTESDAITGNIMQSEEMNEGDCKSIATRARSVVDEELHGMMVRAAELQNRMVAYNYIFPLESLPEGRGFRWEENKPKNLPKDAIGVWAWPFVLPDEGVPAVWAYQMPAPDNTHITVGATNNAGVFRIFYRVRQVDGSTYTVEGEGGQLYYTLLRTRKGRWTVTAGENECSQCKRGFKSLGGGAEKKTGGFKDDYVDETYLCLHSNTTGEMPDNAFETPVFGTRANERAYFGKRNFWDVNMQWVAMSHGGRSGEFMTHEDADPSPYIALGLARMLCKEHAPKGVFKNIGDVCQ